MLIVSVCGTTAVAAPKKKKKNKLPTWAQTGEHSQYPAELFWVGLGNGPDLVSASDQARSQVSAQLRVQITSVVTATEEELIEEDRNYYSTSYTSTVESLVDESIQGIEIVETKSSGGSFYAFAVLNRSTYLGALRQELQDYADQLSALYRDAEKNLDTGEIFPAIENLSAAIDLAPEVYPRQNYHNALSEANFNLPQHLQGAALLSHVRTVLGTLKLTLVEGGDQTSPPGQRLGQPVVVGVTIDRKGKALPVAEMPLRASYASGDRAAKLVSDGSGQATFTLSAVPGERPDAGYARITPNLGRMPDIMGPMLKNLELVVNYSIVGKAAAFAVKIISSDGTRLPRVESAVEETVIKSGFRIDPQAPMVLKGVVTLAPMKEIEVGGSATYQAEARLRIEVMETSSGKNKGSMEVKKMTVSKNRDEANEQAVNKVGSAVKRKALTEMLADALFE